MLLLSDVEILCLFAELINDISIPGEQLLADGWRRERNVATGRGTNRKA